MLLEPSNAALQPVIEPGLDCEIAVLPLGVKNNSKLKGWLFRSWEDLIPVNYTEEMLKEISDYYWEKKEY